MGLTCRRLSCHRTAQVLLGNRETCKENKRYSEDINAAKTVKLIQGERQECFETHHSPIYICDSWSNQLGNTWEGSSTRSDPLLL